MTSKLLAKVRKQSTLEAAWRVIQDNARTSTSKDIRQEVDEFAKAPGSRLRSIQHRLSHGKFEFKPAMGIVSHKKDNSGRKTGKVRPIVLAPLESRIVQRSLLDVLVNIPRIEIYTNTPFSFGGVRKPSKDGDKAPSSVSAAIDAALTAIKSGAVFYASADIKGFFTRISKKSVLESIGSMVDDDEFVKFLREAITTELDNMAQLRGYAQEFPIEDIGVAQGNSLSSLLGNIYLAKFDLEMNKAGNRCIRYVDDFLILGQTRKAVNSQLRKAKRLLKELNMELSPEKSAVEARSVGDGISFLGIQIIPGYIRPTQKKMSGFISSIEDEFKKTKNAFIASLHGKPLPSRHSLIATFKRVDDMIDAWGKSYQFCNDADFFRRTDEKIKIQIRDLLGVYTNVRTKLDEKKKDSLLGITRLSEQKRSPFAYPKAEGKIECK